MATGFTEEILTIQYESALWEAWAIQRDVNAAFSTSLAHERRMGRTVTDERRAGIYEWVFATYRPSFERACAVIAAYQTTVPAR